MCVLCAVSGTNCACGAHQIHECSFKMKWITGINWKEEYLSLLERVKIDQQCEFVNRLVSTKAGDVMDCQASCLLKPQS